MMIAQLLNQGDRLLTYEEEAEYMRCSKVFIRNRGKEGKLKDVRAEKKVLFQKYAIDANLHINSEGGDNGK